MKGMSSICIVALFALAGSLAGQDATVREEKQVIKTYLFSRPKPVADQDWRATCPAEDLQGFLFDEHVQVIPEDDPQHPAKNGEGFVQVAACEFGERTDAATVIEDRGETKQQPAAYQ